MNLRLALIFSPFLLSIALCQEAGAQKTTPSSDNPSCALSQATNGQMLTVMGKPKSGAHDFLFEIPGCNQAVLLTFAGEEDNNVSAAELHRDEELKRFQKYTSSTYKSTRKTFCMECPKYGDVEAELTGKLEIATMPPKATKDPLGFIHDASGKIIGRFGWGHPVPFANYRFVILSVAHVTARKLPPPR
jgi:hypothetical protein